MGGGFLGGGGVTGVELNMLRFEGAPWSDAFLACVSQMWCELGKVMWVLWESQRCNWAVRSSEVHLAGREGAAREADEKCQRPGEKRVLTQEMVQCQMLPRS